jgi:hypothetical protein
MKSLSTKFAFSALAVAMLATPAFAARSHAHAVQRPIYDSVQSYPQEIGTYPNGAARTGTADSLQSGAEFNLQRNNVAD